MTDVQFHSQTLNICLHCNNVLGYYTTFHPKKPLLTSEPHSFRYNPVTALVPLSGTPPFQACPITDHFLTFHHGESHNGWFELAHFNSKLNAYQKLTAQKIVALKKDIFANLPTETMGIFHLEQILEKLLLGISVWEKRVPFVTSRIRSQTLSVTSLNLPRKFKMEANEAQLMLFLCEMLEIFIEEESLINSEDVAVDIFSAASTFMRRNCNELKAIVNTHCQNIHSMSLKSFSNYKRHN